MRLRQSLDEYLRIRRTFGFTLEREGRWLYRFIDFLERHHSDHITTTLAVRWAMASPSGSARSAYRRLQMVRSFAKYLAATIRVPNCRRTSDCRPCRACGRHRTSTAKRRSVF